MSENIRCKRCNRILTSKESIKRGYGLTCYRIVQLQEKQPAFDMEEIKTFITSEIQRTLKEFNFSRTTTQNNNVGIVPVKIKITKMPKFDPNEVNKRLVVKELKKQLKKGINNVLQKVGSFDSDINFLEVPVLA